MITFKQANNHNRESVIKIEDSKKSNYLLEKIISNTSVINKTESSDNFEHISDTS